MEKTIAVIGATHAACAPWLAHLGADERVGRVLLYDADRSAAATLAPALAGRVEVVVCGSLEAMARSSIDGALIAAGGASHTELVSALVDAKREHGTPLRRIVVATPLGRSRGEARRIVHQAWSAGVAIDGTGHQVIQAEAAVAALPDGLGRLRYLEFTWRFRTWLRHDTVAARLPEVIALLVTLTGWRGRDGAASGFAFEVDGRERVELDLEFDGVSAAVRFEHDWKMIGAENVEVTALWDQGKVLVPLRAPLSPGDTSVAWLELRASDGEWSAVAPVLRAEEARALEASRWVASLDDGDSPPLSGRRVILASGMVAAATRALATQKRQEVEC